MRAEAPARANSVPDAFSASAAFVQLNAQFTWSPCVVKEVKVCWWSEIGGWSQRCAGRDVPSKAYRNVLCWQPPL